MSGERQESRISNETLVTIEQAIRHNPAAVSRLLWLCNLEENDLKEAGLAGQWSIIAAVLINLDVEWVAGLVRTMTSMQSVYRQ